MLGTQAEEPRVIVHVRGAIRNESLRVIVSVTEVMRNEATLLRRMREFESSTFGSEMRTFSQYLLFGIYNQVNEK